GGHTFEPPLGPPGYARSLNPHRRPFPTRDGYVCAVIYTDAQWRRFMELLGRGTEFDSDPRYRSLTTRTENAHELHVMVSEAIAQRSTAEWLAAFGEADIPASPVQTLEGLVEDPHLGAVGFFEVVEHPTEGL